jgi:hypothetical protein
MTRHLKTCTPHDPNASGEARSRKVPIQSFHVFVEGRYDKAYWMHLAVPAEYTLRNLDTFLRRIWLECCGHLSAFTIHGTRYASNAMRDLQESGMGIRLSRVVQPGTPFRYEYDYGSTTELNLKVVALRDMGNDEADIELLARNDAPQISCDRCGQLQATQICTECAWKNKGWLCESCAEDHECGSEMCLPVVNSPRAGVCGYAG